jgi:CBS domain-containing protein
MKQDENGDGEVPVRLPIRVRRVELGEGQRLESSSVHCPVVDDSVTLDRCAECSRFSAVVSHISEAQSSLLCSVPNSILHTLEPLTGALDHRMASAKVTEAMATEVVCIDSELGLKEALAILGNSRHRSAPVVDDEGILVGMVCSPDLIQAQSRGGSLVVEELMVEEVSKLRESDTLLDAARLLSRSGHRDLPVLSRTDRVVGMLSAADLVRWIDRDQQAEEPR